MHLSTRIIIIMSTDETIKFEHYIKLNLLILNIMEIIVRWDSW